MDAFLGSFAERRAQRNHRGGCRPPRSAPRRFAAVFLELGTISIGSFCDLSRAGRFFGHFDWAHIAIRAGRERPALGPAGARKKIKGPRTYNRGSGTGRVRRRPGTPGQTGPGRTGPAGPDRTGPWLAGWLAGWGAVQKCEKYFSAK